MPRISWNQKTDPEQEDREAFLQLSSAKRWRYMMKLIMNSKKLPEGAGRFSKRKIEWT